MFLDLPYLGPLSLQTRTKLRTYFIAILNCCKLQIVFKSQNKLANLFVLKTAFPKNLDLLSFINSVDSAINTMLFILRYGECARHLNVRIAEHIGISPLTKVKVKPKGGAVSDNLLLWNHSLSFENLVC